MDGWEDIKGRRSLWTVESESALLEIWRTKIKDLMSTKRNSAVFMAIGVEMELQDMKYSTKEIMIKTKNMKRRARIEREKIENTGMPSTWERYEEMEDILREYEKYRKEDQDDDKSIVKKENDWKTNRQKNSQDSSESHEFDDHDVDSGEDVSTTNMSVISMPKISKYSKNPLMDNRATKKLKLTHSPNMGQIDTNDDIDLFFLSMAKTVKKLPHQQQIQLKQNISNLVFEAELKSITNEKKDLDSDK